MRWADNDGPIIVSRLYKLIGTTVDDLSPHGLSRIEFVIASVGWTFMAPSSHKEGYKDAYTPIISRDGFEHIPNVPPKFDKLADAKAFIENCKEIYK